MLRLEQCRVILNTKHVSLFDSNLVPRVSIVVEKKQRDPGDEVGLTPEVDPKVVCHVFVIKCPTRLWWIRASHNLFIMSYTLYFVIGRQSVPQCAFPRDFIING